MALKKNAEFVIGGVTYVMNQSQVVIRGEELILCTPKIFTVGNKALICKFVPNVIDESLSTIVPLSIANGTLTSIAPTSVEISYGNSTGSDNYYECGELVSYTDDNAYILVNSQNTGFVNIYSLSFSSVVGGVNQYSITFWEEVSNAIIPKLTNEVVFAADHGNLYYVGYYGASADRLYVYDVYNGGPLRTQIFPSKFGYIFPCAIKFWDGKIWVSNAYNQIIAYTYDLNFDNQFIEVAFFDSDPSGIRTALVALVTPFGPDELWVSRGYDPSYTSTTILKPFKITYNGTEYVKDSYDIVSTLTDFGNLSLFGIHHHNRNNSCLQLDATSALVTSTNHGNDPNYSVFIYKVTKDDALKTLKVETAYVVQNPNLPVQLFTVNSNKYIIHGTGGFYAGCGNDVAIYRIAPELPPKLVITTTDMEVSVGDTVVVNGICYFDPDDITQTYSSLALYRSGNIHVADIAFSRTASTIAISTTINVVAEFIDSDFVFVGVIDGGTMDGNTIVSNAFTMAAVDVTDAGLGHIGAFYFGPDYTNALIKTVTIPTFNITVVDYTRDSSLTTLVVPEFGLSVPPELSATTYNPFGFDFSATPVVGSTPLKSIFQAYNYTPKDQYMNVWEAYEFWWWFDYASYSADSDAIVTTTDSVTHIYCHPTNSGRKFDVKLCVKYRLKNR